MAAVAAQPHHQYQYQQQQQQHQQQHLYPSQSVMEDVSDDEQDHDMEDDDDESIEGDVMDPAHAHFYHQQQQQALYYQHHQQQNSLSDQSSGAGAVPSRQNGGGAQQGQGQGLDGDDEMYSDEESDTDSMPDENIDFSLTYALHTFLATVEGQASVVKGDSLVLLDDANSYWWLVRVLKTEDVGYIPAENIETPYERLARLNKHRNVDLAAATLLEKQAGTVQGREKLKSVIAGKSRGLRRDLSGEATEDSGSRRVVFAPPTYVDHPGVTWSSDEEESGDEGGMEVEQVEREAGEQQRVHHGDVRHEAEVHRVDHSLRPDQEMEPDDGVEWADGAVSEEQRRIAEQKQRQAQLQGQGQGQQQQQQQQQQPIASGAPVQPKSNNPFAPRPEQSTINPSASTTSLASSTGSVILDPAQAGIDTRRITATPAVAGGPLLPSAIQQQQQQQTGSRNVSGQSVNSVASAASGMSTGSAISTTSSNRDSTQTSPEDLSRKNKMKKKGSKEDLDGEKKKRGMLGGLFHRKGKDKGGKGVTGNEARSSEESMVSGAAELSPVGQGRWSEENSGRVPPSSLGPRGAENQQSQLSQQQQQQHEQHRQSQSQQALQSQQSQATQGVSAHGLRLQQQDQARMQSYTSKYLNKSPSSELHSPTAAEAAAAVAQSAAAMRLAANMNGAPIGHGGRPSSIILSPNPAGPPLLNVIRIFAGDHIKSESSFKTALINETTSSSDLIRQAMQRFHLSSGATSSDAGYYITVRDVNGEEMELGSDEKPLTAFQDAVKRWAHDSDEDLTMRMGAITPTVKRSSVSSISSVVSLSSHPAIQKLGMNDFSDDSAVKIYINRRRPGSVQMNGTTPHTQAQTQIQAQAGMPEPASEFSSYSTQLSTVQESSPEHKSGEWSQTISPSTSADTMTPPTQPQQRFNPSLTIATNGQASPERFSSPSARFTIQLIIHSTDLPDGSVFDPSSDVIIPRALLRDRNVPAPTEPRKRLFVLPRNANVVEAIEQGLERFGISEGVVDGGDDVEDKVGKRRSTTRVRYSLAVMSDGEERSLFASGRILDVYDTPPNFRPMERTTPEQRRRSRDLQHNLGSASDILPSDPVFVLRRVGPRGLAGARVDVATPRQSVAHNNNIGAGHGDTRSPAEIIAAQRAASRANQNALISAQTNLSQGVDIVLPDQKGTFRSSRLMEADGEVVRYSYIDGDGETYDISELLEEEWAQDGSEVLSSPGAGTGVGTGDSASKGGNSVLSVQPPLLTRMSTDRSAYVTAPSTPEEGPEKERSLASALTLAAPAPIHDPRHSASSDGGRGSLDILRGVASAPGAEEGAVKRLNRVIEKVKVKSGSLKGSTSSEEIVEHQQRQQEQQQQRQQDHEQQYRNRVEGHNLNIQNQRSNETSAPSTTVSTSAPAPAPASGSQHRQSTNFSVSSGRSTPQNQQSQSLSQSQQQHQPQRSSDASQYSDKNDVNATPRASMADQQRSSSRQSQNQSHGGPSAASSVNRILTSSRHRQQPSIASIMSDLETSNVSHGVNDDSGNGNGYGDANGNGTRASVGVYDQERGESDGSSTPITATSSTHPTPPFSNNGAIFTRSIGGSISPTPRGGPVRYKDDFGMKEMMAVISVRAREYGPPPSSHSGLKSRSRRKARTKASAMAKSQKENQHGKPSLENTDDSVEHDESDEYEKEEIDRVLQGDRVDWEGVHPDIKGCFEGVARRLEGLDREIDELLAEVGAL